MVHFKELLLYVLRLKSRKNNYYFDSFKFINYRQNKDNFHLLTTHDPYIITQICNYQNYFAHNYGIKEKEILISTTFIV